MCICGWVGVGAHSCAGTHTYTCVFTCMWVLKVDTGCLPCSLSPLSPEAGSLTEPQACWLQASQLAQESMFSVSPALGLQAGHIHLAYLHEFWDLNCSPHIHLASAVPSYLLICLVTAILLFICYFLSSSSKIVWLKAQSLPGPRLLAPTLLETWRISGSNPDLFNEKYHFNKDSGDFMGELPLWGHHSKAWLCILLIKDKQLLKISQNIC